MEPTTHTLSNGGTAANERCLRVDKLVEITLWLLVIAIMWRLINVAPFSCVNTVFGRSPRPLAPG